MKAKSLEQRIKDCKKKHPDYKDWKIAKNCSHKNSVCTVADVKKVLSNVKIEKKIVCEKKTGADGFRHAFSRVEIAKRKITRLHDVVEKIIDTELKRRWWVPDAEMRELCGISGAEWSFIRQDYSHLLIPDCKDENKRVITVWAHPDCIDELREIKNKEG